MVLGLVSLWDLGRRGFRVDLTGQHQTKNQRLFSSMEASSANYQRESTGVSILSNSAPCIVRR